MSKKVLIEKIISGIAIICFSSIGAFVEEPEIEPEVPEFFISKVENDTSENLIFKSGNTILKVPAGQKVLSNQEFPVQQDYESRSYSMDDYKSKIDILTDKNKQLFTLNFQKLVVRQDDSIDTILRSINLIDNQHHQEIIVAKWSNNSKPVSGKSPYNDRYEVALKFTENNRGIIKPESRKLNVTMTSKS